MVLGMGIVFSFLILLVFVMKAMSRLAMALGDQPDFPKSSTAVSSPTASVDEDVVTAIAAAIHRYRRERRRRP